MARPKNESTVLTIRVPAPLDRQLAKEARRRRMTRSDVARSILESGLGRRVDLASEARRQSRLVSRRRSERDALAFTGAAADGG
ncbi:MAG: hypothetical protein AUF76_03225 [Acidobacteria bacterium 13_1_20CM_2_65_9]|nr:MAG: hypothetical protein AUF76_03225 [Acidobacteria bacterium 13_1_20CM_2_65_9]